MRQIILLVFISIINACTTSSGAGNSGAITEHRIYCSGRDNSWEICEQKASELCDGREYDVVEKYEDEGAIAAYESAQELPDRRLTIRCKE